MPIFYRVSFNNCESFIVPAIDTQQAKNIAITYALSFLEARKTPSTYSQQRSQLITCKEYK